METHDKGQQTDPIQETIKLKQSNPKLARSFEEFLVSFEQYRKVERQFKDRVSLKSGPQPGVRLKT